MTAERFRQIRNVFDAVVEREAGERSEFLAEACQGDGELRFEVEQLLLASNQEKGWLDTVAAPAERLEGRRIGPYEVLRALGEGGMGAVYLAARADGSFRKLAALKIVRLESASPEAFRRFQQEREILASLEHPNIARILDAGETADGLPYLVMEYVDGKPIDVYCDEHRLSVRRRVDLFDQVCSAVKYAHAKWIVHRDLKPSNVLVTAEGQVKLLDFGIAKLLASNDDVTLLRTRTDLRLMTPEYACPEQVRGESVTALSDIYSLGVLLYELLTGRRPYRLQSRILHEVVRVICEEPARRPSAAVTQQVGDDNEADRTAESLSRLRGVSPGDLRGELTGNLDGILLKALEKHPEQRYRSVEEFNGDLQRHLRGEPIHAPRLGIWHTVRTFAQSNPWWLFALTAIALVCWNGWIPGEALLIGSLILATTAVAYMTGGRDFGVKLPTKRMLGAQTKNLAIAGLIMLASYSLLTTAFHLDLETVLNICMLLTGGVAVTAALRWLLRGKLLGALVLDAGRPRNKAYLAAIVLVGCLGMLTTLATENNPELHDFVQLHIANRSRNAVLSGYGDTSVPRTLWSAMSGHDEFADLIAFAPLFRVPSYLPGLVPKFLWPKVPVRFGGREGGAFGEEVSENFFNALRVTPYLGDWSGWTSPNMSASPVVVISYAWWRRNFASDSSVIGQNLYIKGIPCTIIGVASPRFTGVNPYQPIDFWIPFRIWPRMGLWGVSPRTDGAFDSPDWYCILLAGRLRRGTTQQQAIAKLTEDFARAVDSGGRPQDPNQKKPRLYFSPAAEADGEAWKSHFPGLQLICSITTFIMLYLVPSAEIRTQGIFTAGRSIPWRRIAGYSWEAKWGKFEMLRLRLTGPWRWAVVPPRVLVKPELRLQMDELLKQKLMEWRETSFR